MLVVTPKLQWSELTSQLSSSTRQMCSREASRHPGCHHAAHGTIDPAAKIQRCEEARAKDKTCQAPPWTFFDVTRAYCDSCIIKGEILAQKQGLDPGVYCQRMGASYTALQEANPGSLPG